MNGAIHRSVQLPCDRQEAFEHFAVNEKLESWFSHRADVEPTLGGRYELFWNSPPSPPNKGTIGCKVTAIEPNKLLAFQWKGPDMFADFMNDEESLTHVVVAFLPSEYGTEVHVVHSGWGNTPEWDEAREWFDDSWNNLLDNLTQLF